MSYSLIEENVQPACTLKNAYRRFPEVMTGHRSYHPETGRWLSRDPIWDIKPSVSIGQRPRWIRDPKALKLSRVSTL